MTILMFLSSDKHLVFSKSLVFESLLSLTPFHVSTDIKNKNQCELVTRHKSIFKKFQLPSAIISEQYLLLLGLPLS